MKACRYHWGKKNKTKISNYPSPNFKFYISICPLTYIKIQFSQNLTSNFQVISKFELHFTIFQFTYLNNFRLSV